MPPVGCSPVRAPTHASTNFGQQSIRLRCRDLEVLCTETATALLCRIGSSYTLLRTIPIGSCDLIGLAAMFFKPLRNFTQLPRWRETDVAPTAVEGESFMREDFENLPRLGSSFPRRFEIEAHVGHRLRAVGADDFTRDASLTLLPTKRLLVAFTRLPILKCLATIEASEMVSVVMPSVPAHFQQRHMSGGLERSKGDSDGSGETSVTPTSAFVSLTS